MPTQFPVPSPAPVVFARSLPAVAQINVSHGGVPKLPIGRVWVDERGLVGDKQADKKHHGAPHQALSLYALELIEALRAEGHPIQAGSTGENLTTRGLDWSLLVPGRRLLLGNVVAQFTEWAAPCSTIAHCFTAGQFTRASEKLNPGWSRAYAAVLKGGSLVPGDRIELID